MSTNIKNHSLSSFTYSVSNMFERASYYGIRALLVIYMLSETIGMSNAEAFSIYGWLAIIFVFTKIIGGVLGDLLIGNKLTLIIGGALHVLGAISLCIPSQIGLYIGLGLVFLGSGFYSTNLWAQFGKCYAANTKRLDAGFTMLYTATNIGAVIGILTIGYLGDMNIVYGFGFAGVLMLFSIIMAVLSKDRVEVALDKKPSPMSIRVLYIFIAVLLVAIFWGFFEMSAYGMFDISGQIYENANLGMERMTWGSIGQWITLPLGLIAIVAWTFFYANQFVKIAVGFILAGISLGILLLIPEDPEASSIPIFLISLLLFSLAEILVAPIVYSILTKFTNPKYLAIVIALAVVPTTIMLKLVGLFSEFLYDRPPSVSITLSAVIYGVIGIGIVIVLVVLHSQKIISSNE